MTATLVAPRPTTARKTSFYRPELDVLRFFALLAVLLFFNFSPPRYRTLCWRNRFFAAEKAIRIHIDSPPV